MSGRARSRSGVRGTRSTSGTDGTAGTGNGGSGTSSRRPSVTVDTHLPQLQANNNGSAGSDSMVNVNSTPATGASGASTGAVDPNGRILSLEHQLALQQLQFDKMFSLLSGVTNQLGALTGVTSEIQQIKSISSEFNNRFNVLQNDLNGLKNGTNTSASVNATGASGQSTGTRSGTSGTVGAHAGSSHRNYITVGDGDEKDDAQQIKIELPFATGAGGTIAGLNGISGNIGTGTAGDAAGVSGTGPLVDGPVDGTHSGATGSTHYSTVTGPGMVSASTGVSGTSGTTIRAESNNNELVLRSPIPVGGTLQYDGTGGIMVGHAKVNPNYRDEIDISQKIGAHGLAGMENTDPKKFVLPIILMLNSVGLNWPATGADGVLRVELPKFNSTMHTTLTGFTEWISAIRTKLQLVLASELLFLPFSIVVQKVWSAPVSGADGVSVKQWHMLKVHVIQTFKRYCAAIYVQLIDALTPSEKSVTSRINGEIQVTTGASGISIGTISTSSMYFIRNNCNYLLRLLDYQYNRTGPATISATHQALDGVRYGIGTNPVISSGATYEFFGKLDAARIQCEKVDTLPSDARMKQLVLLRVPRWIRERVTGIDGAGTNGEKVTYEELRHMCNEQSRHAEDLKIGTGYGTGADGTTGTGGTGTNGVARRFPNANTEVGTGGGCAHCGKNNHTTENHYECPQCGRTHSPNSQCYGTRRNGAGGTGAPGGAGAPSGVKGATGKGIKSITDSNGAIIYALMFEDSGTDNTNGVVSHDSAGGDGDQVYSFDTEGHDISTNSQKLIVDSGGTAHVLNSAKHMFNIRELPVPVYIRLPNGTDILVREYGAVMITSTMFLTQVLLCPKFRTNIISVARLIDAGCQLKFTASGCGICNGSNGRQMVFAPREGNLYVIRLGKVVPPPPTAKSGFKFNMKIYEKLEREGVYTDNKGKTSTTPTTLTVRSTGADSTSGTSSTSGKGKSDSKSKSKSSSSSSKSSSKSNGNGAGGADGKEKSSPTPPSTSGGTRSTTRSSSSTTSEVTLPTSNFAITEGNSDEEGVSGVEGSSSSDEE